MSGDIRRNENEYLLLLMFSIRSLVVYRHFQMLQNDSPTLFSI